jgi:hypothetical protein
MHVLNNAKQYGWAGTDAYFFDYSQLNENLNDSNKNYIFTIAVEYIQFPTYLAFKLGDKVFDRRLRCYLRYKFYNCNEIITKSKQLDEYLHDQYLKCTFKFTSEHIVRRSAPLLWYLNEEKLEIQIWLSLNDDDFRDKPNSETDKYLGSAFVDMNKFNDSRSKQHRINDLQPIFKSTCKELNGAYCQIYVNLDKIDNFEQIEKSNTVLMRHSDIVDNAVKESPAGPQSSFKCIIGVERALHLPKVYDKLLNRHIEPNPYVTYSCLNATSLKHTSTLEQQSCPVWNYQELASFNVDHLYDESKCLILKVWHKLNPDLQRDQNTSPEKSSDKVLGFVSVDLCPLLSGLQQITGWYNIIDMIGECQGQLKISIVPQESLYEFKLNKINQAASKNDLKNKKSSFTEHLNNIRIHHELHKNANDDDSCLKTSLRKQLNELDEINEKFKEKLVANTDKPIQKAHNGNDKFDLPLNNIQNVINQHAIYVDNAKEVIKKANNLLLNNKDFNRSPIKINDDEKVFSLPPVSSLRQNDEMKFKSNDSFWASKFENESNSVASSLKSNIEVLSNCDGRTSQPIENEDDEVNADGSHSDIISDRSNDCQIQEYSDEDADNQNIEIIEIRALNSVSGMNFDKNWDNEKISGNHQDLNPIDEISIVERNTLVDEAERSDHYEVVELKQCDDVVDDQNDGDYSKAFMEPNEGDKLEINLESNQDTSNQENKVKLRPLLNKFYQQD